MSRLGAGLRSSLRDILLIVVSILIAFVLDAWWDEHLEQQDIRNNLLAVYADFQSTREELTAVLDANSKYIDEVTRLISLELNGIDKLDAPAQSQLTALLPRGGLTFDPVLGSVDALISSGQLNRIRNLEVRSLIAGWPALMDEIGEDQEILIDTYMDVQERSAELGIYLLALRAELNDAPPQRKQEILNAVIQDAEMLNLLAAHRFAVRELGDELQTIDEHLERILRVLEQELGVEGRKR